MTWASFLAKGSGAIAVRLSIEGLPYEFVSDPTMERTTSDGRLRINALEQAGKGIIIDEKVNVPEAKLEGQGISVSIFETRDQAVSRCFAWRPDIERFLAQTLEIAGTTAYLLSSDGIVVGNVLHIGTEAIKVTTVNADGSLVVTRGYWDTIAQKHWSADGSAGSKYRLVTNRPLRARGRRVRIFAYGAGDSMLGDGTQIWLGQVTSEPRCDEAGSRWHLQIASIAQRLKGKLGGELDVPVSPRGINYTVLAPLIVSISEDDTKMATDAFVGFFEDQQSFCDALTTWMTTAGASKIADKGFASTLRAITVEDGSWTLEVKVGTGVSLFWFGLASGQDGTTIRIPIPVTTGLIIRPYWETGPSGARTVPRGYFGAAPGIDPTLLPTTLSAPPNRIYVDGIVDASWTDVVASFPADGTSDSFDGSMRVLEANAAQNYIQLLPGTEGDAGAHAYTNAIVATFKPSKHITSGTLADLRNALTTIGPELANRGIAPFLTTTDLADWTQIVAGAARQKWQLNRKWTLATAVDLEEILANECRLIGMFPIIDSSGKISLAPIGIPSLASTNVTVIDDEIVSVGWSTMERGGQTVNRIVFKTGYDPHEDSWAGRTIEINDLTSYAQDHEDRPLNVEPRSVIGNVLTSGVGPILLEGQVDANALAEAFTPVLGLFGYPHDFITVNVSWKLFGLLLGSVVTFSAKHLPDYRFGVRPTSSVIGLVTARKWELGKPHGTVTILVSWANVGGYSPTARVASQSNVAGNQWDLTISQTAASTGSIGLYAPVGTTPEQYFDVGAKVRIVKYDSESAGAITGTVDSVNTSTHVIRVTFDATWTPSTFTWELMFQKYSAAIAAQKAYAAIAASNGLLGSDNAKTYGP